MSSDPVPMSVVVNDLREIVDNRSGTDFGIYYDDYTILGKIQHARSKVKAAWDKKIQENYKANDHQVDAKEQLERTDLVAGELEYALESINQAISQIEQADGDHFGILPTLERNRDVIRQP